MNLVKSQWIFIEIFLTVALLGGQMSCATKNSGNLEMPKWTGKFPVLVIAHRGFSGKAPENTLASFKKAIEAGADVIEFDVRFSRDGHLIVFHDDTLERTTKGKGRVADFTLQELKELDAGSWMDPQFSGEKIPTLGEVLDLTRGRVLLNIELKIGDHGRFTMVDLADRTLGEVEKTGMERQVLFSSFDPVAVEGIQKRNPRILTALITRNQWTSPAEAMEGRSFPILHPRRSVLNEMNLSRARQQGVKINVWTVNTEEEMEKFISMGVDGIITDHPDRLIAILKKRY